MLPSARKICSSRLVAVASPGSSSFSQALPPESSRQALLRTAASHTIHSNAAKSRESRQASAAYDSHGRETSSGVSSAEWSAAEDGRSNRTYQTHSSMRMKTGSVASPKSRDSQLHLPANEFVLQPQTPEPSRAWLDSWLQTYNLSQLPLSPLPLLETFRGLIASQPLLALLTLPKLSRHNLYSLRHREARLLLKGASKVARETPAILLRISPEDCTKALRVLRAVIYALPEEGTVSEPFTGKSLRGKILRDLITLCFHLNCPNLAKSIFQERLREQLATDATPPILNFEDTASYLAVDKQWERIVELFSPETFPHRYYTPKLVALYMRAHFGIHQSCKVPKIFELHNLLNLQPTTDAINALVQAFLEMGELSTARTIAKEADMQEGLDYASQQLAILRGYRVLGWNQDLETKVLKDIERLHMPLKANLLHALVKLRLDANDLQGAEALLYRFDLGVWGKKTDGKVAPTRKTGRLFFTITMRKRNLEEVESVWAKLYAKPGMVDDEVIETLLRALVQQGLLKDTFVVLESALLGRRSSSSRWSLPPGAKPGIRSLNYLLGAVAKERGLEGLELGMSFIHLFRLEPNSSTLKIIVDFARASFTHSPDDLATLVSHIMEKSPLLPPNQSVLDSIVASTIAASGPNPARNAQLGGNPAFLPSGIEDTFHPTAGLVLSPSLFSSLSSIITALESVDSRSSSRALANRLRYDAMTNAKISGVPSAHIVWNSLIARGFTPTETHILALMQGYADAGHMYDAQELCVLASTVGVPISKAMLHAIMTGWGQKKSYVHARAAYEEIRALGKGEGNEGKGLDLMVVTSMLQCCNLTGKHREAADICYTDLQELDVDVLDDKAANVVAQTLRTNGDLRGTLQVFAARGRALGKVGRRIVKGVKQYAAKLVRQGVEGEEGMREVEKLAGIMLSEEKLARKPYGSHLHLNTQKRIVRAWMGVAEATKKPGRARKHELGRRFVVGEGKGVGMRAMYSRRERLRRKQDLKKSRI